VAQKERVQKDGLRTGASLYGVLVHDASLGGLKGLGNPSGDLKGDIISVISPEIGLRAVPTPSRKPFFVKIPAYNM
jgi:hypothetical protein